MCTINLKEGGNGPTRGGEGFIVKELEKGLGISEGQAFFLKNLRLADLNGESIAFAKERLAEIGRYDN